MQITCCKYCVAPKRHRGCHATCEEYLKEKEEIEARKQWLKESTSLKITEYDFNQIAYADYKRHKKRNR